jgi:hypothetical protein
MHPSHPTITGLPDAVSLLVGKHPLQVARRSRIKASRRGIHGLIGLPLALPASSITPSALAAMVGAAEKVRLVVEMALSGWVLRAAWLRVHHHLLMVPTW